MHVDEPLHRSESPSSALLYPALHQCNDGYELGSTRKSTSRAEARAGCYARPFI